MVAPVLLGIGAAVVGLGVSILGKKGPRYYVAYVAHGPGRPLVTKQFPDEAAAKEFQARLSQRGRASIIIVKEPGKPFECKNPVAGRKLTPEELTEMKAKWEGRRQGSSASERSSPAAPAFVVTWQVPKGTHMVRKQKIFRGVHAERQAGEFRRDLTQQEIPSTISVLKGRHDDFDTLEEQFRTHYAAERNLPPESAETIRQRRGPYPETMMKADKPIMVPDFRETASSHEWKTDVKTRDMPTRFYPPVFYGQKVGKNLVNLNPLSMKANTG